MVDSEKSPHTLRPPASPPIRSYVLPFFHETALLVMCGEGLEATVEGTHNLTNHICEAGRTRCPRN
jgi:hypothetical protein